jgi:hypothetical protein
MQETRAGVPRRLAAAQAELDMVRQQLAQQNAKASEGRLLRLTRECACRMQLLAMGGA